MAVKRISALTAIAGGTLAGGDEFGVDDASDTSETKKISWTNLLANLDTAGYYKSGGTDVAVADGGTGSSTAGGALTNLGVTAAAQTVTDDATVAAMVNTLGGASSTGTGGLVRATSPTLVTPALGTPASGVATNLTGTAASLTAGDVASAAVSGKTAVVGAADDYRLIGDTSDSNNLKKVLLSEPPRTAETGTTYTLAAANHDNIQVCSNAGLVTVTIPTNAAVALPVGFTCVLLSTGAGGLTLTTTSLTLLGSSPNKSISQNEAVWLTKHATDTWSIIGATAA